MRSCCPKALCAIICVGVVTTLLEFPDDVDSFTLVSPAFITSRRILSITPTSRSTRRFVASTHDPPTTNSASFDDDNEGSDDASSEISDEELLNVTPRQQLVDLCKQFSLDTEGTKTELLQRLRDHAQDQAEKERKRLENRRKRVDEGGDDRERFEIVEGDSYDDDEDDDPVFYYHAPTNTTGTSGKKSNLSSPVDSKGQSKALAMSSQAKLTAPPPPPVEPDENGERVVTVYSTADHNDLTGIAAAQPGQAAQRDPMLSGGMTDPLNAPWDTNNPQKNTKETPTTSEIDAAKAEVSELVQVLLAMSGAPGFQQDYDDDISSLMGGVVRRKTSAFSSPERFVGFDPAAVPTEMLIQASKSLRTGRGAVLAEVLREFELRAVGYDGAAGDEKDRGGGHYRQVSKVRSFLDGFRLAEVRRLARETTTLLLDKLVCEGIEGLDIVLATMTRSNDETGDEAGELNDSLLDYLNDAIRQQEKKVEQLVDSVKKIAELENSLSKTDLLHHEDAIEKLWRVETEEGQRVETFDPNDPISQEALRQEVEQQTRSTLKPIAPKSAPEQLLLLLTLLRERVKTEATFSHDEKSRNLRVLAYCLNLSSDDLRKELITREFGSSLDRLDSFAELVASSIEYAESTSHQLQPSKQGPLNGALLKRIQSLAKEIRDMQAWKASGAKSTRSMP